MAHVCIHGAVAGLHIGAIYRASGRLVAYRTGLHIGAIDVWTTGRISDRVAYRGDRASGRLVAYRGCIQDG